MTTKITGANIDTIANTGVKWNAVTVADGSTQLTASAGNGYFLDTNAGVIEVFLPASPSRGDTIVLADYAGHFALNNVLVNTGGQLIDSVTTVGAGIDYKLATNNLVVELVYVDSNKGWLVKENEAKSSLSAADDTNPFYIEATGGTVSTVNTDFKVHAFTGDGCFVVATAGNSAGSNKVSYVVVAGGGGGVRDRSGGGGAGGYREGKDSPKDSYSASPLAAADSGLLVSVQTYPISVGAGGAGDNDSPHTTGNSGSNSVFSTITSAGGGAGNRTTPGSAGGSGGGGGHSGCGCGTGGAGNTPPVSPPQGNPGGAATTPPSRSGGGGGAGAAGACGSGTKAGGAGVTSCITGSPVARGGGGGGIASGTGGSGGGGAGGADCSGTGGGHGTANTGGGAGGGGSNTNGGNGGKGVVVIRYKFQN